MRFPLLAIVCLLIAGMLTTPAMASEQNTGIGIMAGYSIAKDNNAVEDVALGVKYRLDTWEAAMEFFRADYPNGGWDKMGVVSVDYLWDFARIPEEDFGIYVGTGLSYLGAADYWGDTACWNVLVGYDYTKNWSLAGKLFYTLDGGDMFAIGGFTYLF
jgi:hypothetical protein